MGCLGGGIGDHGLVLNWAEERSEPTTRHLYDGTPRGSPLAGWRVLDISLPTKPEPDDDLVR
jgi:hypothetical protein